MLAGNPTQEEIIIKDHNFVKDYKLDFIRNDETTYKSTDIFTIGESPLEMIFHAVENEYENGIRPNVNSKDEASGDLCQVMERYIELLAVYSANKAGYGTLDICPDGCRSDLMYCTKDNPASYIGIQVKTTTGLKETVRDNGKNTYCWQFAAVNKDYKGILMYFRSIIDGEGWLIPYNDVNKYYKAVNLSIVPNPSRKTKIDWDKYKVNNYNIGIKIHEFYLDAVDKKNSLDIKTLNQITLPVFDLHQQEHEYRKKIVLVCSEMGLKIGRPIIENMPYDFILGELKIQEKVATANNMKSGFICELKRRKKLKDGTIYLSYVIKDFDILAVHIPDSDFLYFIPMIVLKKRGIVSDVQEEKRVSIHLYPNEIIEGKKYIFKDNWPVEFLLSYKDPNFNGKMKAIYYKQIYKSDDPILIKNPLPWNFTCKSLSDLISKGCLQRTYPLNSEKYTFKLCGKRILEKIAFERVPGKYVIDMTTIKNGKIVFSKYGEFDYIYVRMTGVDFFYLFPASMLKNRNLLTTDKIKGQKRLPLAYNDKEKTYKNDWMEMFAFFFGDVNFEPKLMKMFEKYDN